MLDESDAVSETVSEADCVEVSDSVDVSEKLAEKDWEDDCVAVPLLDVDWVAVCVDVSLLDCDTDCVPVFDADCVALLDPVRDPVGVDESVGVLEGETDWLGV